MLIVRGVNVFPTALREVVHEFAPRVSGVISVRPTETGVKQSPPLPIVVEMAETEVHSEDLAEQIARRIREKLTTTVRVELVKYGTLPRTDYKSKLIDWSLAR